ncbi:MAG TPA: 2-C-methyl-D-erythritol 4-phosphate cytidylyltransferase [Pyrinomonadaceae bacterium]|nr:2-C-methyl-D-erythritol 4-phosphate cytidylyltransferase [Pyrinomonadaceae bacterium]
MNVAIVVAGGKGTRFGGNRPKQFLELNGAPLIVQTLRQFERCTEIESVIVVLPAEEMAGFQSLIEKFDLKKVSHVVTSGDSRAQSVRNGLATIDQADIVAVHDGVRPLVTPEEIDRVVRAARASGAAILVAPIGDTVKEIDNSQVKRTLPRQDLRRALTPQCFRFEILKRAYDCLAEIESSGTEVTDDSFLVERLDVEIVAVEGSARNIKITNQEDLALAEMMVKISP